MKYRIIIIVLSIFVSISLSGCSSRLFNPFRWAEIEGKIEDQYGNAIENATVELNNHYNGIWAMKCCREVDGQFRFEGLRKGIYALTVKADGYNTFNQYVEASYDSASVITVVLVRYTMAKADYSRYGFGSLHVRVIDVQTREGLPGVSIWLENTDIGVAAGLDGYYDIGLIPASMYTLKIFSIGYSPIRLEKFVINADDSMEMDFYIQTRVEIWPGIAGPDVIPLINISQPSNRTEIEEKEIETMPSRTAEEILEHIPGFVR